MPRQRTYRDLAEEFERRAQHEYEDSLRDEEPDDGYEPDYEEMLIRRSERTYEVWD